MAAIVGEAVGGRRGRFQHLRTNWSTARIWGTEVPGNICAGTQSLTANAVQWASSQGRVSS